MVGSESSEVERDNCPRIFPFARPVSLSISPRTLPHPPSCLWRLEELSLVDLRTWTWTWEGGRTWEQQEAPRKGCPGMREGHAETGGAPVCRQVLGWVGGDAQGSAPSPKAPKCRRIQTHVRAPTPATLLGTSLSRWGNLGLSFASVFSWMSAGLY